MPIDLDFLRELCSAPAPSGFEAPVQEVFRRRLADVADVDGDPLGNVWADTAGAGEPHIVLAAHADQIGLIVTYIDEQGFVTFDKIGGVDAQLLPGRSVLVHSAGGAVPGVVGRRPSHKMSAKERAKAPELCDQWLDIGATSRDDAFTMVQIGDPITFPAAFLPLANGRFASPAFDNRAGVYVCARGLEHYAADPATARLTALATVHEETTFMGAKAIAARWQPDVVIVVDVDFASDDPGMDAKKLGGEVRLGARARAAPRSREQPGPARPGPRGRRRRGDRGADQGLARPHLHRRRGAHGQRPGGHALAQHPAAQHALGLRGCAARGRRSRRPADCRHSTPPLAGLGSPAPRAARVSGAAATRRRRLTTRSPACGG